MADAVVSSVIEKLADLLIEEVASLQCDVQDQVESVQRELTSIHCFLKDADVKQKSDDRVRNWIRDIRDVAYDVEDVLDTYILSLTSQRTQSGLMGCLRRYAYCFSDLKVRKENPSFLEEVCTN